MKKVSKIVLLELVLLAVIFGVVFYFGGGFNNSVGTGYSFVNFENAHQIYIDDNPDFDSPEKIGEDEIELSPGTYYWRAEGLLGESEEGSFSVDNSVIIRMKIKDGDAVLENIGDVPIDLAEKRGGVIIGKMVIAVNDSVIIENVNEDSVFEASQK